MWKQPVMLWIKRNFLIYKKEKMQKIITLQKRDGSICNAGSLVTGKISKNVINVLQT